MELLKAMAERGNPNSVSDAGVGALALRSAILGAGLNVRINTTSLNDTKLSLKLKEESLFLEQLAIQREGVILEIVNGKILPVMP